MNRTIVAHSFHSFRNNVLPAHCGHYFIRTRHGEREMEIINWTFRIAIRTSVANYELYSRIFGHKYIAISSDLKTRRRLFSLWNSVWRYLSALVYYSPKKIERISPIRFLHSGTGHTNAGKIHISIRISLLHLKIKEIIQRKISPPKTVHKSYFNFQDLECKNTSIAQQQKKRKKKQKESEHTLNEFPLTQRYRRFRFNQCTFAKIMWNTFAPNQRNSKCWSCIGCRWRWYEAVAVCLTF